MRGARPVRDKVCGAGSTPTAGFRKACGLPPASIGGTLAGCPILLRRFPVSPSWANRWSAPMPCATMPMHWRACGRARAASCWIRTAAPLPAMTISHWR
ncbi:hypothetical protein G6F63_014347 [Rhizopus arrhizus]|nr:hypothetical protein G6F63_014347 [Rhizopus arrhizus]